MIILVKFGMEFFTQMSRKDVRSTQHYPITMRQTSRNGKKFKNYEKLIES